MLSKYLNQEASFEIKSNDKNVYGEYDYEEPKTIAVRRQDVNKEVKTSTDTKELSTATYYMIEKPKVGDLIDSNRILFVAEWVDFGGQVVGYKAMV